MSMSSLPCRSPTRCCACFVMEDTLPSTLAMRIDTRLPIVNGRSRMWIFETTPGLGTHRFERRWGKIGLGELLFFEGEGEFFPLGEESGALGAEGFKFGGVPLGLVGGGEVAETGFGGGYGALEAGDFLLGVAEAVF